MVQETIREPNSMKANSLEQNGRERNGIWRKRKAIIIGSVAAVAIAGVFGIWTVLIPNTFFTRMTPIHWYDYLFLAFTAILGGASIGFWYYGRGISRRCTAANASGMVGGVFSFGCAICNKLLLVLLGVSGVMTYFMPLQPYLGVVSVGLLSVGVYGQYKSINGQDKNLHSERIIKPGQDKSAV